MLCLCFLFVFFFFKQKTAYEMRISDWSSDVCSSDLHKPKSKARFAALAPPHPPPAFAGAGSSGTFSRKQEKGWVLEPRLDEPGSTAFPSTDCEPRPPPPPCRHAYPRDPDDRRRHRRGPVEFGPRRRGAGGGAGPQCLPRRQRATARPDRARNRRAPAPRRGWAAGIRAQLPLRVLVGRRRPQRRPPGAARRGTGLFQRPGAGGERRGAALTRFRPASPVGYFTTRRWPPRRGGGSSSSGPPGVGGVGFGGCFRLEYAAVGGDRNGGRLVWRGEERGYVSGPAQAASVVGLH